MKKENVQPLFESKFIKVYDLQYAPGKHYYDASRRNIDQLVAIKDSIEKKTMLPDAASLIVIIHLPDQEPKLLLSYEYRYVAGEFLLSVPAGIIDKEDQDKEDALILTAKRELFEETGIQCKESDRFKVIEPFLYSTPGFTDESNGLVYCDIELDNLDALGQSGATGGELFNGFALLTKEEAKAVLKAGRDENGHFYSVYTWMALCAFASDLYLD